MIDIDNQCKKRQDMFMNNKDEQQSK